MMSRLEARRDRLAAVPSTPARIQRRPTGRTFADRWAEADQAGRRQLMIDAGFQFRIARTPIGMADVAAEIRRQGITRTPTELRNRAAHIREMAAKTTRPERLAVLAAELEEVEATRRQMRAVRRHDEVISVALDDDSARRAGLAAAGNPVPMPAIGEAWDEALAPLRRALTAASDTVGRVQFASATSKASGD
jgi:hypothetical protein